MPRCVASKVKSGNNLLVTVLSEIVVSDGNNNYYCAQNFPLYYFTSGSVQAKPSKVVRNHLLDFSRLTILAKILKDLPRK